MKKMNKAQNYRVQQEKIEIKTFELFSLFQTASSRGKRQAEKHTFPLRFQKLCFLPAFPAFFRVRFKFELKRQN